MIRTTENLIKALDFLSTNTSPTACARHLGANPKLIWQWANASADDEGRGIAAADSPFGVRWPDPDGEPIYFHNAILQARKIFLALATMEATSLIGPDAGTKRMVVESGKVQWTPDPLVASHALTMSDDAWEVVYGADRKRTDIWARDSQNCLVPLVVTDALPSVLKIHLLRSLISAFNIPTKSEVDVKATGGVLVLRGPNKQPRQDSPMRADLQQRLADLRAKGPANPKPNAPVSILGRATGDAPDKVSNGMGDDASRPAPEPKPQAPHAISYARPRATTSLDAANRPAGRMPAGGFSMSQFSGGRPRPT